MRQQHGVSRTEDFDVGRAVSRLSTEGKRSSSCISANITNFEKDLRETWPGLSIDDAIDAAIDEIWPAPGYREHQKEAIRETVRKLYIEEYDVVTVSAPTGAGKSLIIYAASKVIEYVSNGSTFSTTPLNSLIDQIKNDDFITDVVTLKGKSNYECVHSMDKGASVDDAICQRMSGFDCEHKDSYPESGGCPYYGRKNKGRKSNILVTNLSYLMGNSMIPSIYDAKFEKRDLLAIDEVQNVEDFALQFIGFSVSDSLIPVDFDAISSDMPRSGCDMEEMVDWLYALLTQVTEKHEMLSSKRENEQLTNSENDDLTKLKRFVSKLSNFLQDWEEGRHWTKTRTDRGTVKFEPVFIDRFIDSYLWQQSEKIILSSATIPKGSFLDEIGLAEEKVYNVSVESTFDPARRPVITDYVGKMTKDERRSTIPKMADKIGELANHHQGENGFVHCNSYDIAEKLYEHMSVSVQDRTRVQDPDDREGSLEDWLHSDSQIFLSVAMDEGISLDDEQARWQVVAKASYPFMGDERVSYRLNELNDWEWYHGVCSISVQQAAGRGMRSKDDWCCTYLLDSSFKSLLNRNRNLFEPWFLEAVNCHVADEVSAKVPESKFTFTS